VGGTWHFSERWHFPLIFAIALRSRLLFQIFQESTRVDGAADDEEVAVTIAEEKRALEQALRDIAQSVIADADLAMALSDSPRASAVQELTESMADLGIGSSPR